MSTVTVPQADLTTDEVVTVLRGAARSALEI
jgi:hypothetical protein